jgi:hypothetical protein
VLEVAAYSAWLSATSEAEAQHWTSALTHFNTAHSILAQLAQVLHNTLKCLASLASR